MKKTIGIIAGLLIASAMSFHLFAQAPGKPDSTQLWKEFQKQTENWKLAYNSGDAKNLAALYSDDATYLSSHVPGLEAKDRDNVITNFQKGMSGGGHIDTIEILSVNTSCELTTLLCRYQATNSGVTVIGRNLLVLKKVSGKWLIILHMTVV